MHEDALLNFQGCARELRSHREPQRFRKTEKRFLWVQATSTIPLFQGGACGLKHSQLLEHCYLVESMPKHKISSLEGDTYSDTTRMQTQTMESRTDRLTVLLHQSRLDSDLWKWLFVRARAYTRDTAAGCALVCSWRRLPAQSPRDRNRKIIRLPIIR